MQGRKPRSQATGSSREDARRHYDVGNDFYELWLDREMVYTCAYFDPPDATLEEAQRAKMEYAPVASPASKRRVAADGVLLVGDAAGLAWPESGEGIRTAVESGLLAARVVEDARGDYRAARIEPYGRALEERFGKRGRLRPSRRLPGPIAAALASALMPSRWFARRVLLERWFLRMRMPALVTPSASWAVPSAASGDRAPIRSPRSARSA